MNSEEYIKLLENVAVPIIKLNYGSIITFQEDNSAVHKAKKVQTFMKEASLKVLEWPPKSPNLNIIEDVWRFISDKVYDGPQFKNVAELSTKINKEFCFININERPKLLNLYSQIRGRLCKVLQMKGNLYNK